MFLFVMGWVFDLWAHFQLLDHLPGSWGPGFTSLVVGGGVSYPIAIESLVIVVEFRSFCFCLRWGL